MENNNPDFFPQYWNRVINYINNLLLLGKLQVTSKLAKLLSMLMLWAMVIILSCLVILFVSFCAAYYFSDLFDSNIKGFGLVALIYILFTVLILVLRKNAMKKFIVNKIIDIIFEKTANDDEDDEEQTKD